jgi:hypothetical protein
VSVGFNPTRNYQPLVEFEGTRITPLPLTEKQLTTLAIHLPRLCQEMCTEKSYQIINGDFAISISNSYKVARLTVAKRSVNVKLSELRYLLNNFMSCRTIRMSLLTVCHM